MRFLYISYGIYFLLVFLIIATYFLDDVTSYFEIVVEEAKLNVGGRRIVEGSYGVFFFKIVVSIRMILEVFRCIEKELTIVNLVYIKYVNFKFFVILIVEYFNFKMREVYEVFIVMLFLLIFCCCRGDC